MRYRAPYASEWTDVPYAWAMERIAERIKDNADPHVHGARRPGAPRQSHDGDRVAGGATLDNEENYLIAKLFRNVGTPFIENQARI